MLLQDRGISIVYISLKEEVDGMSSGKICEAVKLLLEYDQNGERAIVHCDFGQNRSRTIVEAFYYAKFGEHFQDEYKGYFNHLICNCNRNFISRSTDNVDRLKDIESLLQTVGGCRRQIQNR